MIPYALRASGIIAAGSFETGKYVIYFVIPLHIGVTKTMTPQKARFVWLFCYPNDENF